MDSGHYAPPRAPVADAPVPEILPRATAIMAVALVSFVAIQPLVGLGRLITRTGAVEVPLWVYLLPAMQFALLAAVALLLWKRKGWSRWVLLALAVFQISMAVISTVMILRMSAGAGVAWNPMTLVLAFITPVFLAAATALVFGPARGWFRKQS